MGSIKMVRIYINFSKTAEKNFMEHEPEILYMYLYNCRYRPKSLFIRFWMLLNLIGNEVERHVLCIL